MPTVKQNAFNRAANDLLSPSAGFEKYIIVGVSAAKKKFLKRIFASASLASAPAVIQSYIAKLCVCTNIGKLQNSPTLIDYNVLNTIGSEQLDLGTKYYEQTVTLPLTYPIEFDNLPFEDGEAFYVVLSFPYANGETLLAPAAKNVFLSIEGYYQNDNQSAYRYR